MSKKFTSASFTRAFNFMTRVFMGTINRAVRCVFSTMSMKSFSAILALSVFYFIFAGIDLARQGAVFSIWTILPHGKYTTAMQASQRQLLLFFCLSCTLNGTVYLMTLVGLDRKTTTTLFAFFCYTVSFCNISTFSIAVFGVRSSLFKLENFVTQWTRSTNHGFTMMNKFSRAFYRTYLLMWVFFIDKYFTANNTCFTFIHKKTSCLVNWVLAEGTQSQTRGNENYNRFSPVDKQLCTLSTSNYSIVYGLMEVT